MDMGFPPTVLGRESASGPISRRGWQADGCSNRRIDTLVQ